MATNIILSLVSGLIGSIIGASIGIYGALCAVRRAEFYRLRIPLKDALRDVNAKLSDDTGHPAVIIENDITDNLFLDVIAVTPCRIRKTLQEKWNKYRYDEKTDGVIPIEYTKKGTVDAKKLIKERLHNIISLLQ